MIFKHTPVGGKDVRRVYYSLPLMTLILIWFNYLNVFLLSLWPKLKNKFVILLSIIILLNIMALPYHSSIIKTQHLKEWYKITPSVITCIKENKISKDKFNLKPKTATFCGVLRSKNF